MSYTLNALRITSCGAISIALCLGTHSIGAGETCLEGPRASNWDLTGGTLPLTPSVIAEPANDPICGFGVELEGVSQHSDCEGWIGKQITAAAIEVEHLLAVDMRKLDGPSGGEIVIFEALRSGQPAPTLQISLLDASHPQLRLSWHGEDSAGSKLTDINGDQVQYLSIRWRGSVGSAPGLLEVQVNSQEVFLEPEIALTESLPDSIRLGVIACEPPLFGTLLFAPVSTTLLHL